jgi:hypothetical protein
MQIPRVLIHPLVHQVQAHPAAECGNGRRQHAAPSGRPATGFSASTDSPLPMATYSPDRAVWSELLLISPCVGHPCSIKVFRYYNFYSTVCSPPPTGPYAYIRALDGARQPELGAVHPGPRQISPLTDRLPSWHWALAGHPDKAFARYVLDGMEHGFRVGFDHSTALVSSTRNMPSALGRD